MKLIIIERREENKLQNSPEKNDKIENNKEQLNDEIKNDEKSDA